MSELEIGGQRLSYDAHGDGDPVFLLSNLAQDLSFWPNPFVGKLNDNGYRTVVVQHLGPAADLGRIVADFAQLIETLEMGPAHLWGYSQGGMFAQELALARPDLVRSAVLMATIGRKAAYMRLLFKFVRHIEALREREPDIAEDAQALITLLNFPPKTLANDALVEMITTFARDSAESLFSGDAIERSAAVSEAYENRLEALAGIRVPCLVLAFGSDMNALAAGCQEVADAIPGARYVEIEGAAHSGIGTHGQDVLDTVLKFLADV
ncbi:MAG: alpha/beta fold hydrolase [Candidatus Binatia bacterium]